MPRIRRRFPLCAPLILLYGGVGDERIDYIATALRRSPTTKFMIMGGMFDAATPWWNMRHTISQLYLPAELRDGITFRRYACGHMCYVDNPTLERMTEDLRVFYHR